MKIMALDWGTKRIGGAISDENGKIAFALDRFFETKNVFDELIRFTAEQGVEKIIVGNPVSLSGEQGDSSRIARDFAETLRKKIPIPIEMVDERFSSVFSQETLARQGIKQKEARRMVDNLAAQKLLQTYLEKNN